MDRHAGTSGELVINGKSIYNYPGLHSKKVEAPDRYFISTKINHLTTGDDRADNAIYLL